MKNKFYVRPPGESPQPPPSTPGEPLNIEALEDKLQEVLRREVYNLMSESSKGKLGPNSSKNLIDYLKLIEELRRKRDEALDRLTEEQLSKIAEEG